MKYLKMLGLAAVAVAALMAFVGATSASATVLCHTTSTPCVEKWKVGTEPRFTVRSGGAGIWETTGGTVLAECPEGELRGVISNAGGATETVKTSVEASGLTWQNTGGCFSTKTVEGGTFEVHSITGTDNGTVTVSGFKITINNGFFGDCTYGFTTGEDFGTLTASGTGSAIIDVNTIFIKKEGGITCPEELRWTEEFMQEKPSGTALYVEPS